MDELKIIGFEQSVVDLCNKTPIPNRVKMYVLKEIANKLLDASERDYAIQMRMLEQKNNQDKKGGEE